MTELVEIKDRNGHLWRVNPAYIVCVAPHGTFKTDCVVYLTEGLHLPTRYEHVQHIIGPTTELGRAL